MEQAHQPATNNHINRYERLGTCRSMISGIGMSAALTSPIWFETVIKILTQLF
jgi:hypothetical protein